MPTNDIEKNQLIIKILFLLIKNKINSSIFRKNEADEPEPEPEPEPEDEWKGLKTKELLELQEMHSKLATISSINNNKHKQIPVQYFNYDDGNYGFFGMLKPLINLVKSLFGSNSSNTEGGFIGQLYKSFSNIRIYLNPETSLSSEEKELSKYSKLFNMAADQQYKSFNKHYRELVKNNSTEKQILKNFLKLIENDSEVDSKKNHFLLFQQAEKKLLGGKITAENMSEILSKRVEENLNKVLEVYLVISDKIEDELNDLTTESEKKITAVKIIIKNLVEKIIKKESELEKFRLENKSEENKIKYELYQSILKYKKKLYSFILRTDAWAMGETLHQDKVFDVDYIKKQFDKFPNKDKDANDEGKLANYNFDEEIKHKGVLKLFEDDSCNLKKDIEYQENIKICKKENIKKYLLDNIASSIKSYNYLSSIHSSKISENKSLQAILRKAESQSLAPQVQLQILETANKYSKLTGEIAKIAVNIDDFKERIISFLCDYYKMEDIAENIEHERGNIQEKINEFIQNLSPTILLQKIQAQNIQGNTYLTDILNEKFQTNIPQIVNNSIKDNDVIYFNTLEKLKFFASKLNDEANTFVNSLKLDNKPNNIRTQSFSRPSIPS